MCKLMCTGANGGQTMVPRVLATYSGVGWGVSLACSLLSRLSPLACKPLGSISLYLLRLSYKRTPPCPHFLQGVWGPNSDPRTQAASIYWLSYVTSPFKSANLLIYPITSWCYPLVSSSQSCTEAGAPRPHTQDTMLRILS